jgi:dolichyl-phosphate beta-glucosyltransferase
MSTSRHRDGRGTPQFSLVFPTYNPGGRLARTLGELDAFAGTTGEAWEFVFVCDGCDDGTAERLHAWRPRRAAVRVLSYAPNRGKGFAVRQGLLAASAPFRIFTDIDLAYSFVEIRRVASALVAGHPVVMASRAHRDSVLQLPATMLGYAYRRQVQSRLFGLFARALLPLNFADTQAGLKGLSESVVRDVVPRLRCNGFAFDCELLTACARLGLAVTEVPVCVRYDGGGSTTGWGSVAHMLRSLWRIRRAWPKGRPPLPTPATLREAG